VPGEEQDFHFMDDDDDDDDDADAGGGGGGGGGDDPQYIQGSIIGKLIINQP